MRSSTCGILVVVSVCLVFVAGCRGKAVGTAALRGNGTATAQFQSSGKQLVLWADTDGEWQGASKSHFPAHYEIDVLAKGVRVAHVSCDSASASTSVCGSTVTINSKHRGDCELKLNCQLPIIPAGPAAIQVTGTVGPGVTNVTNMSINVREK